MIHQLDYKGYTIICENGLYWIATEPYRKHFSFEEIKKVIDKRDVSSLFVNRRGEIIKEKQANE